MAGLGLGSHLGGALSLRLSPQRALLAFGLLEVLIAVCGVVSVPLYYDLLYTRAPGLYAAPWLAGLVHFASLLPPTALMGMSLPFLTRAMVEDAASAGRTIGVLYGINMLGAGAGALLTPWVLVRHLGLPGAVMVAAAANAVAGLAALALARGLAAPGAERAAAPPTVAAAGEATGRFSLVAGALRRGWLLRALPRDPLVPAARRDHALHRVHLRHAAGHLPLRLRGGLPARRAVGAAPWPAAAGLPALPVRPAPVLGPGRPRPRGPAPDDTRPLVVPRVLAEWGRVPPGRHVGPRPRRQAVPCVAARSLRASDRPHGAVVPSPPAGRPGRPRHLRAQGGPPASGQHRGLCRGQPRGRPRRAHLARDEWLAAPPAGRRGRLRRSGPAGVRSAEPLRTPRRAPSPGGRRATRARSALVAPARGVVVAGDGGRGRHQRRGDPAVDRRVARGGQRQAPQPASFRRRPHAARGDPGARPSLAGGRRHHRPGIGRHRLGRRCAGARRGRSPSSRSRGRNAPC